MLTVLLSATLVLLGTAGGPTPKLRRAAPSQAIVVGDRIYVVDAGNGVGRQIRLASLPLENLRHVFVTHHHSDHVADLVTLPLLAWASGLDAPIVLHGPPPIKRAVKAGLKANAFDIDTRIADEGRADLRDLVVVHEIRGDGIVLKDDRVTVTAARVEHPPIRDAYAYRFDGEGFSVVISGDTRPSKNLVRLAQGADVLVHEVLILDDDAIVAALGKPKGHPLVDHVLGSHTRFRDVGRIAAEAGVATLVLSHFVPGDATFDKEAVLAEIRKSFSGEVIFGEDLMKLELPRPAVAPMQRAEAPPIDQGHGAPQAYTPLTEEPAMEAVDGRVLVVGDPETLVVLRGLAPLDGCEVEGCHGQSQALRRLRQGGHEVVVTGRSTSMEEDLAFLDDARVARPGVRGIVIVPSAEREEVIASMRAHVFALFTAPFDAEALGDMVSRAIGERDWKDEIELISGLPNWLSLRVAPRRLSAERLVRFMDELQVGVSSEIREGLLLAFRELLLNAMEHGAGFGSGRTVEVSAVRTERTIVYHFRDPGEGFRLDQLEHAAISSPPEDPVRHMDRRQAMGLRPGGFGMLIASRIADELYYSESGNQVLLIKHTK